MSNINLNNQITIGSEKQINWALKIKQEKVGYFQKVITILESVPKNLLKTTTDFIEQKAPANENNVTYNNVADYLIKQLENIANNQDAKFWIDNRARFDKQFIEENLRYNKENSKEVLEYRIAKSILTSINLVNIHTI